LEMVLISLEGSSPENDVKAEKILASKLWSYMCVTHKRRIYEN